MIVFLFVLFNLEEFCTLVNEMDSGELNLGTGILLSKSGSKLPLLGYGTYLCTDDIAAYSVRMALEEGYRHIDTAEFYENHEGVRAGIEASGIPRNEIFITDKFRPGGVGDEVQKTYDDVINSFEVHCTKLGTDYVDLYLLHHAFPKSERLNQWRALVDLQKQGKIKEIGVSNWNISHIEEIKAANLPLPAVNQIEIHPFATQVPLISYLRENSIVPIAYSSLAPLSNWREGTDQHSLSSDLKVERQSKSTIINDMSSKYGVSEAQLLLRWALQHSYPILPKSSKLDRIQENKNLYHFTISEDDMIQLDGLDEDLVFAWPNKNPLHCP